MAAGARTRTTTRTSGTVTENPAGGNGTGGADTQPIFLAFFFFFPSQQSSVGDGASYTRCSSLGTGSAPSHSQLSGVGLGAVANNRNRSGRNDEHMVDFAGQQSQLLDLQQNDDIVISAAMQQLRDPGVLIVAHGSQGKPKTVRLQLTEQAITWRTETRKRSKDNKPKMGTLHQVPLSHFMYVDVGKQTTALRRVENASVSEALCFSLLTKEGSLDLEANSPRQRDALVSCFSVVLDEVHAQNWRDIYRGPSSGMPSSSDELDPQESSALPVAAPASHLHDPHLQGGLKQLRDPGVLIVAHGSRGKPRTVRLQLTEQAITWRTETRKRSKDNKPKMGTLHQVPLSYFMYVDVGKQTTALRRVENASVSEALCFSLLTKEGSLDLEANSPRQRDALVSCFSLVLDEVHAQNWRDIYRGPSSGMPSSSDELDPQESSALPVAAPASHLHDPHLQGGPK